MLSTSKLSFIPQGHFASGFWFLEHEGGGEDRVRASPPPPLPQVDTVRGWELRGAPPHRTTAALKRLRRPLLPPWVPPVASSSRGDGDRDNAGAGLGEEPLGRRAALDPQPSAGQVAKQRDGRVGIHGHVHQGEQEEGARQPCQLSPAGRLGQRVRAPGGKKGWCGIRVVSRRPAAGCQAGAPGEALGCPAGAAAAAPGAGARPPPRGSGNFPRGFSAARLLPQTRAAV